MIFVDRLTATFAAGCSLDPVQQKTCYPLTIPAKIKFSEEKSGRKKNGKGVKEYKDEENLGTTKKEIMQNRAQMMSTNIWIVLHRKMFSRRSWLSE